MQLAVVTGVGALGGVCRVDDVRRAALAAAVAVQVRVVRLAGDARGGVLPLGAVEREVVRADALVGGKRAALVAALAGTEEAARGVGGGVFGREPRPYLEARQRGVDRVEVNCDGGVAEVGGYLYLSFTTRDSSSAGRPEEA